MLTTIKEKCRARAMPFAMFVTNPDAAAKEIDDGCSFLAIGTDSIFLWSAAKNALKSAQTQPIGI
jgi:2-keto-3-deoxy-L-rhamnonate aldolase RhmA